MVFVSSIFSIILLYKLFHLVDILCLVQRARSTYVRSRFFTLKYAPLAKGELYTALLRVQVFGSVVNRCLNLEKSTFLCTIELTRVIDVETITEYPKCCHGKIYSPLATIACLNGIYFVFTGLRVTGIGGIGSCHNCTVEDQRLKIRFDDYVAGVFSIAYRSIDIALSEIYCLYNPTVGNGRY